MTKKIFFIIVIFLIFNFYLGCMSLSTLQTAETLEPGKVQIGTGMVFTFDDQNRVGGMYELSGRIGIVDNFDMGLKLSPGIPDFSGKLIFLDAKYQFYESTLNSSFDFGWSNYHYNGITFNSFYPMLIIGQDHWYSGVKGIYFSQKGEIKLFGSNLNIDDNGYVATTLFGGFIIGGKTFKSLIELNVMIWKSGEVEYVPGIGFNLTF